MSSTTDWHMLIIFLFTDVTPYEWAIIQGMANTDETENAHNISFRSPEGTLTDNINVHIK
jgi:hypothetical protein